MTVWFKNEGLWLSNVSFIAYALLVTAIIMISSVVYKGRTSQTSQTTTKYQVNKWPLMQIVAAKTIVVLVLFIMGEVCTQQIACVVVTVCSSLQFWLTKNAGRRYLQACWSFDTSSGQEIWVYEAGFKSPASLEELFWYSQIVYGGCLLFGFVLVAVSGKLSLLCAIIIAFTANYINFFAFSKIIEMRNAGIFEQIAQQANAEGEIRETIRLPMVHRSQIANKNKAVDAVYQSWVN